MNAAERIAIKAITALLPADPTSARELLVELVGHMEPPANDPSDGATSRKARNQREYRRRQREIEDRQRTGNALPTVTGNANGNVTGNVPPNPPRETLSFRDSVSNSETERGSETRVRAAVTGNANGNVTGNALPDVRAVQVDDPIPPELEEAARGATGATPVVDVAGAWMKFCGHYASQVINVRGKWQMWCVNEAKREASDRAKARGGPVRVQPVGADGRAWKIGEET